jgi:Lysine methyltransferase
MSTPRGATSGRRPIPRILLKASEKSVPSPVMSRRSEFLAVLHAVGPLRAERVVLPGTAEAMEIQRPVDFDRLIDDAAADPEQNLPYWAELWPSGVALAAKITRHPEIVRGRRVLELGCGLGVTAVAALKAGADLLVTDYAVEALALCSLNALDHTGRTPDTLRVNWRRGRWISRGTRRRRPL